ncbi:MAG: GNAT family N-acetyltransferase [Roseibium aggregatum]
MIPALETERLILRPMTMSDWPAYEALMASDRSRYMGGPLSRFAAWGLFCHDIAQWQLMGHGALMMEARGSGEVFGQVGINHGPLFPEHELGWFVYEHAEGRGYAFEAAGAFRDWARQERRLPSLVSYMDQENTRSARLAERLGAHLDVDAARPDLKDIVYRHY